MNRINGKYSAEDIEILEENDEDTLTEKDARNLELWMSPEPDEILNIGEVNVKNWKDYKDIATNSLWIIGSRSREGVHTGKYHGNFVPQIPYQAIRRFTKPGDVVLDTFLGSGTTLIESRRLGRHGIGIELVDSIAEETRMRINSAENPHQTWQEVIQGDSTDGEIINQVRQKLATHEREKAQLLIMHPPYHDIIKFSQDQRDLSNAYSVTDFLDAFKKVVYRTYDLLEQNHFLVVVIGDKYSESEWIPLGFRTMEAVQSVGYTLKSIVIKNIEGNRAKRNLQNFWRQRAFRGNYFIFKHEYILFFEKTERFIFKKVIEFVRKIQNREELELIHSNSFVSGDALKQRFNHPSISPTQILALKHNGKIVAITINLTSVNLTPQVKEDLEDFVSQLPDSVVDISVLAEPDDKAVLYNIPGISQVYSSDDASLELLAHALYIIRKATGSGQRAGRAEAVAFASDLNEALAVYFKQGEDYEWRRRGKGIGFRFFKKEFALAFDEQKSGSPNFLIGLETKWISGHEKEKAPQIRDNFLSQDFELIAVVGHNVDKWETFIREQGNFADYYLFLSKGDEKSLKQVIQERPLLKAFGEREFKQTDLSLVNFLKSKKPIFETEYIQEQK